MNCRKHLLEIYLLCQESENNNLNITTLISNTNLSPAKRDLVKEIYSGHLNPNNFHSLPFNYIRKYLGLQTYEETVEILDLIIKELKITLESKEILIQTKLNIPENKLIIL